VLTEKEATFAGNLLQMLVVDDIITTGGICFLFLPLKFLW